MTILINHNHMQLKRLSAICLLAATLIAGCGKLGKSGAGRQPQPDDTLYTGEAAMLIYVDNPDRALLIIDSAVAVGNLNEAEGRLLRARVYANSDNDQMVDSALRICEPLLESGFAKDNPTFRENILDQLIDIARKKNNQPQYLQWATMKVDLCYRLGENTEMLRTEAEIGVAMTYLGQEEYGLAKLDGVIANLDGQRHFNEMDACIIAMKRKIKVLGMLERDPEIIPVAKRIIAKLDDYRQNPSIYDDGSIRMPPNKEHRESYCDFYTSQAIAFMARGYTAIAIDKNIEAAQRRAATDSARHYLALYEQSDMGHSYWGRYSLGTAWCRMGEYNKMNAIYDEILSQMGSDTINEKYTIILRNRATQAEAEGRYHTAADLWRRYALISKQLSHKLQISSSIEYATRYHLLEERQKTEREELKARQMRLIAIGLSVLVLMAIGMIIWLLFQRHSIGRKNRALVAQIDEAFKYKQMHEATVASGSEPDPDSMTDEQLFDYISQAIRREQLYLNPNFGRQTLTERFGLSNHRIGAAFAHGSQHNSLPDFVRNLRLEHACRLLTEHPDMSIADVASASGFSNATVFGRDFKGKYAVTPTFYRSNSTKKGAH